MVGLLTFAKRKTGTTIEGISFDKNCVFFMGAIADSSKFRYKNSSTGVFIKSRSPEIVVSSIHLSRDKSSRKLPFIMTNEFIGAPKDFHYMEGSEAINFRKTFDLNGTQNDEMLRLYLRKAGLSDEIECLTAEQRRAFIYDIIKSNKMPGYWLPSTMQNSNYNAQRQKMHPPPPPPPPPSRNFDTSLNEERRNVSSTVNRNQKTMSSSSSAGDLTSATNYSPLVPRRFVPAPKTPPSPSTFVTNSKGTRYEISGPINLKHNAGDLTRDMTRNAFDLTSSSNDNVLRKYMMERGISEDDIAGMRKTDVIRKIVQSKFTWIPPKKNKTSVDVAVPLEKRINYATISGYPDKKKSITRLRPAINTTTFPQTPSPTFYSSKPEFANYTWVTSRFADVSRFPTPNDIYGTADHPSSSVDVISLPPLPLGTQPPEPPPRKSQYSSASLPTIKKNIPHLPPTPTTPPSSPALYVANNPNVSCSESHYLENNIYQEVDRNQINGNFSTQKTGQQSYLSNSKISSGPPPAPILGLAMNPALLLKNKIENVSTTVSKNESSASTSDDSRDALLESIRKGVNLKHNEISAPGGQNVGIPAPPPPPPPPPMPKSETISSTTPAKQIQSKKNNPVNNEDGRDALLESIRKGVNLKKIDKKAATISGTKARTFATVVPSGGTTKNGSKEIPVVDFLTELKMGFTARRMKNPEDNPFRKIETND